MKPRRIIFAGMTALLSCGTMLFVSCEKEQLKTETSISSNKKTSGTDEYEFNKHLTTATVGLLSLSQTPNFKALVNARVAEQWDGDDNVLLSTLKEDAATELSMDLTSEFQSAIGSYGSGSDVYTSSADIDLTLSLFDAFDDVNHPQIYIPFASSVNLNDNPVICVGYSDGDNLVGYKVDAAGSLNVYNVDETFAQNNLVWVVSVNENLNLTTPVYTPGSPIENNVGAAGVGDITNKDKRTPHQKELWINSVEFGPDKKEKWHQGKYELAWTGAHYHTNNYSVFRVEDKKMLKVSTAEMNQAIMVGAGLHDHESKVAWNGGIAQQWESHEDLGGLFFEYDKGKSSKTWHLAFNGGSGVNLSYRSEDSPYGNIYGVFSQLGSETFWKFTPEIPINGMKVSFKHRKI